MAELNRDECSHRLAAGGIGRVAVSIGGLPAVFPVNFALLEGDVVFRTGPGTKLDAATAGAVIAFEIDHFDPFSQLGWSVLVVGTARRVTDVEEQAHAEHLPLTPWADGSRDTFVRLEAARITGRELTYNTSR
jgi:nitroimidazol reductase NimA-like FMN-containing flavoprotein (pyridoxamine 5'-phosphate oxidase superfamily)